MKNALVYLTLTKLKNQIKQLVKSPAKIIYIIFIIFLIAMNVFAGNLETDGEELHIYRDMAELSAIALAFFTFMFIAVTANGFKNGASMFAMADVNLIFTGPFKTRSVLFYGLIKQAGTSLLLGFFIFFQYTWMKSTYNINYGFIIACLIGYGISVFMGQFIAMLIYSFTSANEKIKNIVKYCFYAYYIILAGYLILTVVMSESDNILQTAVGALTPLFYCLVPVTGWMSLALYGVLYGNIILIVIPLVLIVVVFAALLILVIKTDADFYEDVLKSAEISQSAINASKEGVVAEAAPQNIKLGKTGLGKGLGANAIFYKHLVENRRSRVFIMSTFSLIFSIATILFSFFLRDSGLFPIFMFSTYMQIFSVMLGRFGKELTKPYVYLIPEPPVKKLFYTIAESFPGAIVEALLIYVPIYFIVGAAPLDVLSCIIARISFSFVILSGNIAVERIWGGKLSKSIGVLMYFIVIITIAAPGIIIAAVLVSVIDFGAATLAVGFLILAAANIPVSLLTLFCCRNLLQYAELTNS